MKSCRKLPKYCSIDGKNREIFGPSKIFGANCWTLFGSEITVGERGGRWLCPLALHWLRSWFTCRASKLDEYV